METEPAARVSIFASYAPQDESLQNELKEHLRPLHRAGLIELWQDHYMSAGTEWKHQVNERLHTAQIILLLVSRDFMNSDYCYDVEMKLALERHERGEAYVIPIILHPVFWQRAPFAHLQVLPPDCKPITTWPDREVVWQDMVQALSRVVASLQAPGRA